MNVWRFNIWKSSSVSCFDLDLFIFRHTSWGVKDEPEVTPDEGAQGHKVDLALAL